MGEKIKRHKEPRTGHFEKEADGMLTGTVRDTHEIKFDEPTDLPVGAGDDEYPSPVDYMFASLVGCQISVLNQALKKARVDDFQITADAQIPPETTGTDNVPDEMPEHTGNRIKHVEIELTVEVAEEDVPRAERCLEVYDKGCIVGQSFRAGIEYTPHTAVETRNE
jgi:uncharacterized OsmC-like protein